MDLFDLQREENLKKGAPLAARMRPETLIEFAGQEHIVGEGTLLYRAISADKLRSVIFYGPPGTGKTTLAHIIANSTKSNFTRLNATTAGVKDIKSHVDSAKALIGMTGQRTILFVDEIHRFNKAQQDALLPFVEDGTIILIGATTENPYFEVNKALISRSLVFELKPLEAEQIKKLLKRAVKKENLNGAQCELTDEAEDFFAEMANGDARAALNALELGVLTTNPNKSGVIVIDLETAQSCIQKRALNYDKDGDNHYDTISAFIKSMRGSDPDAALYYLARMIYAGEDVRFIARRIVIHAAEDVGNADPHALMVATTAAQAADFVGFPEAQIILAQAVIYISCAPKSNSSLSVFAALEDVKNSTATIPRHLKDAHYKNAKDLGNGVGYAYPHSFPGNYVKQQYLPDELIGRRYYEPSGNGVEKRIKEFLENLRGMAGNG